MTRLPDDVLSQNLLPKLASQDIENLERVDRTLRARLRGLVKDPQAILALEASCRDVCAFDKLLAVLDHVDGLLKDRVITGGDVHRAYGDLLVQTPHYPDRLAFFARRHVLAAHARLPADDRIPLSEITSGRAYAIKPAHWQRAADRRAGRPVGPPAPHDELLQSVVNAVAGGVPLDVASRTFDFTPDTRDLPRLHAALRPHVLGHIALGASVNEAADRQGMRSDAEKAIMRSDPVVHAVLLGTMRRGTRPDCNDFIDHASDAGLSGGESLAFWEQAQRHGSAKVLDAAARPITCHDSLFDPHGFLERAIAMGAHVEACFQAGETAVMVQERLRLKDGEAKLLLNHHKAAIDWKASVSAPPEPGS